MIQLKKKESISNAVGVKQFAIFEENNDKFREQMEDSTFNSNVASFIHDCFLPNCPKSTLFGVFDGHGGKQVSTKLETLLPTVALV